MESLEANETEVEGGFYAYIRWTLLTSRFLGLLPLSGLMHSSSKFARYKLKTFYSLIYIPCLTLHGLWILVHIYNMFLVEISLIRISGFVFTLSGLVSTLLILRICKNWSNTIKSIENIERSLPPFKNSRKSIRIINSFMITLFLLAAGEHSLFILYKFEITKDCFMTESDTEVMQAYYKVVFDNYYKHVSFCYLPGVLLQIISWQATYLWNFIDVMIIVLSIYLVNRFQSFNSLISDEHKLSQNEGISWKQLQNHYTQLTRLVDIIDDQINPIIFLSFSGNLFFLCQQLFYVINKEFRIEFNENTACVRKHNDDWEATLYLPYSFLFLMIRAMLVSSVAAHLHTLSRQPLNLLHTVPASDYNTDTQRFLDQVYHTKVSLSGLKFFYVTRSMILTMIATLLTYELVLLQVSKQRMMNEG